MADERTEKATPKRREEARKKGQIVRGAKLPAALGFLAALAVLQATGGSWLIRASNLFAATATQITANHPLTPQEVEKLFFDAVFCTALLALPTTAAALAASLAGNFLQGGFLLTPNALSPRLERFNPIANLKRIFSANALVELGKSLLELTGICLLSYGILTQAVADAPQLIGSPPAHVFVTLGSLLYKLGLRVGGILLLSAAIDYGYKWFTHERSLRMTKQELKDEFRQTEGDPLVKNQRRRVARARLQYRLAVEVPRADVVVTNPTHFAVALRYDRGQATAPIVVAKGADLLAKRIRELANAHDVAIVENPPLARGLYNSVEIGKMIPPEFFRTVAELLAYVYRQRQTRQYGTSAS
ncbi:MAG: flagellar biosynthesis protein FlhB [Acidobacteriota bacterium]